MAGLNKLRISLRLYIIVAAAVIGTAVTGWVSLSQMRQNTYELREMHLRDVVDAAVSQLAILQAEVDAGNLELAEAQARGSELIRNIRYDGDNYIFASDYQGIVKATATESLIGTSAWDLSDPNGVMIYQELIAVAQSPEGGLVHYAYQRPSDDGSDAQLQKISFARGFEPWGWMVGTGSYVEDLEAMIAAARRAVLLNLAVGLAVLTLIGTAIAQSVSRPLRQLSQRMEGLSNDDLESDIPHTEGNTETAQMARGLVTFRDALRDKKALEAADARARQEQEAAAKAQQEVVATLGEGLARLSEGDLTETIDKHFAAEFEPVRADFNTTVSNLREIVAAIMDNANEIHGHAGELSGSSQNLAHRTEGQAATLEETAAALSTITSAVKTAADGADQAQSLVKEARDGVATGSEVVAQTVEAMNQIKDSSESISKIIAVIDNISYQTNLLALNAGVEAARAGEAGRGFAVVASEVRTLAQNSSKAATEIKQLVQDSSAHVAAGVDLVDQVGSALGDIVERVSMVSDRVTEITEGTAEQSAGLAEVNETVNQLDQVTQENAAMVEETTAASTLLEQGVENLRAQVARFRLEQGHGMVSGPKGGSERAGAISFPEPVAVPEPHIRPEPSDMAEVAMVSPFHEPKLDLSGSWKEEQEDLPPPPRKVANAGFDPSPSTDRDILSDF